MIVIHLLVNNPTEAEAVYQKILGDYPEGSPAYPITQMATAFWNEYQQSENISNCCSKALSFLAKAKEILTFLTGGSAWQGIDYLSDTSRSVLFANLERGMALQI